ncbi:MAG: RNA 2',3'-cyclic phosphodiesterase [Cyanobacteria bacterium SZAS LIN-5]|nr:RNA 2',3'-cyclic phosphodiesterase [Cyanobacteria bacterium SZAS LIN-5]RTL41193.1 MAG: RNA 2',3'-cyclic phosphodiesterase [Candidatus Melainabacteria bacterium]
MPKLFIGTFLKEADQQRLAKLPGLNEHLETVWARKIRWVKPVNLHITWLYLGDVDRSLVSKVSSTLQKVIYERNKIVEDRGDVTMSFAKPSVWPDSRKARVLVVESQPVTSKVEQLARSIRTGLIPFYSEVTEKEHNQEFRPHVTLIRLDRRVETPAEKLSFHRVEMRVNPNEINSLDEVLPIELTVENVCLVESDGKGGDYRILDSVKLSG